MGLIAWWGKRESLVAVGGDFPEPEHLEVFHDIESKERGGKVEGIK